ncbi:MAG: hypothetical protein B7X11_02600 [Acidobacteria bacterium 37-65-4]|nr:MAG: hypothetical protein B7X11_02600 [Acidobacteria bacterium 37-65-4]
MTKKHPLGPFRPPEPPSELKARALRASEGAPRAVKSALLPQRAFGPWDWAWAAALLLLVLAHALLGPASPKHAPRKMAVRTVLAQDSDLAALGITNQMMITPPSRMRRDRLQGDQSEVAGL